MEVARICSDLVKIRSENPPGDTQDVIEYIRTFCDSIGKETRIISNGKKWNLLSKNPKGKLLLCGHVDVVPALDEGWKYPPNSGVIQDECVHGRGSTDMKGGCASILAALSTIVTEGTEPGVDIAFVCDEEGNGEYGMEYLVRTGEIKAGDCIIAEPTPEAMPVVGEKGMLRINLTFSGNAGHSSLHPVLGDSAIMQACRFMDFCHTLHEQEYPLDPFVSEAIGNTSLSLENLISISADDAAKVFSHIMYNPGTIHGGERVNVVAQRCEMEVDMRLPWGCSPDDLLNDVISQTDAKIEVEDMASPSFTPPCSVLDLVSRGIMHVYNRPARPGVMWAATDARYLRAIGSDVIIYGPGDLSLLHSVNEKIPIRMLEKTQKVYEYCIRSIS